MKNFLLFLMLVPVFTIQNIRAEYYAGSTISLSCIGGNTYLVTLTFYRDCEGISAPSTLAVDFTCSSNNAYNFTAHFSQIQNTGFEITPSCSSAPTYCSGGTAFGVQEYIYQQTVTLPPCNTWKISHSSAGRRPLTTVSSAFAYSVSAELNNLDAPGNSTPVFSNKPILVAIKDQLLTYNNGAIDPDGDSLAYSFYNPKSHVNSPIVYTSPYSYNNFISSSVPITINPNTGQITLKPNLVSSTVSGVRVEEWRKINGTPTLIGAIHLDLILIVYSSGNSNPVLSGINLAGSNGYNPLDTIYSTTAIANQPIHFSLSGFDPDTFNANNTSHPENFSITWNNGIPQANFIAHSNNTDSAWAEFSWTPTNNNISKIPHCFTATVMDDGCPYKGMQIYSYCITVTPPALHLGNDTNICVNNVIVLDGGSGNFSYQWSTGDTSRYLVLNGSALGIGTHNISLTRMGYGYTETDSISITVNACTGIENSIDELNFSVMPNPNHGVFHVIMTNIDKSIVKLEIYNSEGKTLYSEIILSKEQEITKRIDLGNLSAGVYFLKIQQGEIVKTQKIIVQ